jgi:predicted TIM-barrel fold metal-dependent hydrolase
MRIIDTDVHQSWVDPKEIQRRLPAHFRHQNYLIPSGLYHNPVDVNRLDAIGDNGEPAGASYEKMRDQHLDAFGIEKAILTGNGVLGLGVHPHAEFAKAVARAYNEALLETWLTWDDRFYGSMLVAPQDPAAAAVEIRRLGSHPRIVEVLMCSATRIPYGQKFYWPIYEAAQEMGLPVALHPGTEGRGISNGFIAGPPSTYLEWHTNLSQNYMGQIVSLVCEGVFEKFPRLMLVAKEGGLAWIPGVLWRLDKNWKGLRSSVPWLRGLPSETIIKHIRFTTQPVEEPERPEFLPQLLRMIHAEKTLMFSSDYPHWDNDSPHHALPRLDDELQAAIFHRNAEAVYPFEKITRAPDYEELSTLSR